MAIEDDNQDDEDEGINYSQDSSSSRVVSQISLAKIPTG
jgi:hypothetical protein